MPKTNSIFRLAAGLLLLSAGISRAQVANALDLDVLGGGFLKINLTSAGNLNTADDPVEGLAGFPLGRNFSFTNVRVTNCTRLIDAKDISPQKPLEGLSLANITGNCTNGISLANISGAKLRDIRVNGYTGAFLTVTNVQGVGLQEPKR